MLRNIVIGFALVLLTIIAVTQVISVYKTHFAPSPEPEIAATHRWTEGEALAVFQSWATVRDWFTTDSTCWSVITDFGELTPTVIQGESGVWKIRTDWDGEFYVYEETATVRGETSIGGCG